MVENIPTITVEERNSLECDISLEEASFALKNIKNKQRPGWASQLKSLKNMLAVDRAGPLMVRPLNEGFKKQELSITLFIDVYRRLTAPPTAQGHLRVFVQKTKRGCYTRGDGGGAKSSKPKLA